MGARRRAWFITITALGLVLEPQASARETAPRQVLKHITAKNAGGGVNSGDVGTELAPASRTAKARTNGISYHGGPVILGTTNAYVIWYGNWPGTSTTPAILTDMLGSIGGSPYFNINTTYYNGSNTHVTNAVALKGTTTDAYSRGVALSDNDVQAVVQSALSSNRLPVDPNGVYFVLTSSDVSETSGFLTQYCGWHSNAAMSGADIKFAFVGDPSLLLSACAAQTSSSPNGNVAADAMASIIAHELEESVTDPDLNAWFDTRGNENADKCAWTFGTTYPASNGSRANMKLGTRNYLIQRNWVNANGGSCQLKY